MKVYAEEAFQDSEVILEGCIEDYEKAGFTVPDIGIVNVGSLGAGIEARYVDGTMYLVRATDEASTKRVIAHELGHAVTMDLFFGDSAAVEVYRTSRVGNYKLNVEFNNSSGDDLDYRMRLYNWYAYTLKAEEILAEDVYFAVYGLPTMHEETIGMPTKTQQENLKTLLTKEHKDYEMRSVKVN